VRSLLQLCGKAALTMPFQNLESNHHDRSASGGSTTAVVGLALDDSDLDLGAHDYRLPQTLTDEYAMNLS
jgi:hypothetical protein